MTFISVRGNALSLPVADASVDLIITSPPYFAHRSYESNAEALENQIGAEPTTADFLKALWDVTAECWRVLKPTGSMWVNLGDKYDKKHRTTNGSGRGELRTKSLMGMPWRYALGCIDANGEAGGQWILRSEVIWHKPNGLPESVSDRVVRKHEQWFHLTKEEVYFSAADTLRRDLGEGRLGPLPDSVWSINTEGLRGVPDHLPQHFAAYPSALPARIIQGWAPEAICTSCGTAIKRQLVRTFAGAHNLQEGERQKRRSGVRSGGTAVTLGRTDQIERRLGAEVCACGNPTAARRNAVVLDPFGGSGTTAAVAHHMGRTGISVDLSEDYARLAAWRAQGDQRIVRRLASTDPCNVIDLSTRSAVPPTVRTAPDDRDGLAAG